MLVTLDTLTSDGGPGVSAYVHIIHTYKYTTITYKGIKLPQGKLYTHKNLDNKLPWTYMYSYIQTLHVDRSLYVGSV